MARSELIESQRVPFGRGSYVDLRHERITDEATPEGNDYLRVTRGYRLGTGEEKDKSFTTLPADPETVEAVAAKLLEYAAKMRAAGLGKRATRESKPATDA